MAKLKNLAAVASEQHTNVIALEGIDECGVELSIVMPCLNEAETLAICIKKAQNWLTRNQVVGEIIIADNGSSDGSQTVATVMGARVVP